MRLTGVEQTVEAFFRAESGRLLGALTLYTGDRDLAAELVQEAFARAHDRWPHVRALDSPAAWTYRVAVDLSVDDAARRMGCAPGTVRSLTAQGVARLRESAVLLDLVEPHRD